MNRDHNERVPDVSPFLWRRVLWQYRVVPSCCGYLDRLGAPLGAAMLRKYRFFSRLGFFGVDQTPRGAAAFLRTAGAICRGPNTAVWVTAEGEFSDVRRRPLRLRPG